MSFLITLFLWITLEGAKVFSLELPRLNKLSIPEQLSIESRAKILCVASSGEQPIEFHWIKDGKPFSSGRIEQLDEWTSSLTLYPLSLDHIGNYTCVAKNNAGKNQVTAPLFVTAPPHWIVEPYDIKISVGEKAIFHCEARGSPEVKIIWKRLKDSEDILPLPSKSQVHNNGSLIIPDAHKNASGFYQCEAVNGIGKGLKKNVLLIVYEYPAVERLVDYVIVERGQVAHLSCLAKGDVPLSFLWMKNRKSLDQVPHILRRSNFSEIVLADNFKFTLLISDTQIEDEGLYTCVAQNEFGSDRKDIRLMLVERPQPPQLIELVDIWSRNARVKWITPKSGNSPILSYTLEYWSNSGGHWSEVVDSPVTSCMLKELKPYTTYTFHVWATNDIGDSKPSQQSQFTTAKEEPSAAPLDFKLEDVGSTFVRLSWKSPPHEDWNGDLKGYYVGYRQNNVKLPFTYNTVETDDDVIYYILRGLRRGTRYLVTVRSFNDVGSGPSTEDIPVKTLDHEPPPQPVLIVKDIGSTYLQIIWYLPEESKINTARYSVHFRKSGSKWQEISIPDASQTSYTLTNLDPGVPYQIYIMAVGSSGISEPSETATVRTSNEAIFHNSPKRSEVLSAVDDATQIMYIVVPVAIATVIIVTVIVTACVYVYSKRPLPPSHPYTDASKNFSYMTSASRHRDMPITMCNSSQMKIGNEYGSPYSTVPLTHDDEEPIYESVVDDMRYKINQQTYEDKMKIGNATIV